MPYIIWWLWSALFVCVAALLTFYGRKFVVNGTVVAHEGGPRRVLYLGLAMLWIALIAAYAAGRLYPA